MSWGRGLWVWGMCVNGVGWVGEGPGGGGRPGKGPTVRMCCWLCALPLPSPLPCVHLLANTRSSLPCCAVYFVSSCLELMHWVCPLPRANMACDCPSGLTTLTNCRLLDEGCLEVILNVCMPPAVMPVIIRKADARLGCPHCMQATLRRRLRANDA